MSAKSNDYCAFLLRLWRDGEAAPWRASLEVPGSAQTTTFANMAALFAFLEQRTRESAPPCEEGKQRENASS